MRGRAAPPHPGIYRVPPRACNYTNKAVPGPKRFERNTYYRRGTLFIITFYWKFSCLFSKLSRSLSEFFPLFDFTEIAIAWPSTFFTALGPKQSLMCSQAEFCSNGFILSGTLTIYRGMPWRRGCTLAVSAGMGALLRGLLSRWKLIDCCVPARCWAAVICDLSL